MSWWGKVIGGTLGAAIAGPIGALLGAAIGHGFDSGLKSIDDLDNWAAEDVPKNADRSKAVFFTTTFLTMGHLAKADGRVSEQEIETARNIMSRMQLNAEQKHTAMTLFNQGKQSDFDLDVVISQFYRECGRQKNLLQMFLEIQLMTALADGELHPHEQRILHGVARSLHFSSVQFDALLAQMVAQQHYKQAATEHSLSPAERVNEAYQLLGVQDDCSDAELKKAYRRQISQHHPDKLVAKGLPEEMMRLATEKTREIKDAYELIKAHRSKK